MSKLTKLIFLRKKYSSWAIVISKATPEGDYLLLPEFMNHLHQYNTVNSMDLASALDILLIKNGGTLNESLKQLDRSYAKQHKIGAFSMPS